MAISLLLQDAAASGSGLVKTPPSGGSTALGSTSSSPFAKEGEVIIASLGPGDFFGETGGLCTL